MMELRVVPGKTGRLLTQLLTLKRVPVNEGTTPTCIVSYGCRVTSTLPTLNSNAGRLNKYEELQTLASHNISTIPHVGRGGVFPVSDPARPPIILGRAFKHTKGRDISLKGKGDYFTLYVPQRAEYRVWAFRGRCLGVYQKTLEFPWKARRRPGIAWNWRRGYAFKFFREAPEALKQLGINAIRALDLDFGAVDILEAVEDGKYYVLEVNTAPGTQGPRQGLTYLATKIARWYQGGFKKRKERNVH